MGNPPVRTSEAEWERHRPVIEKLYSQENRTQKDVQKYMAEVHNFRATKWQYETHFKKWALRKNHSQATWRKVDSLIQKGELAPALKYNGQQLSDKKIKKAISRYRRNTSGEPVTSDDLSPGFVSANPLVKRAQLINDNLTPTLRTAKLSRDVQRRQIKPTRHDVDSLTLKTIRKDHDQAISAKSIHIKRIQPSPRCSPQRVASAMDETTASQITTLLGLYATGRGSHHGMSETRNMLPMGTMAHLLCTDGPEDEPATSPDSSDWAKLHCFIYALSNDMIGTLGFKTLGQLWLHLMKFSTSDLLDDIGKVASLMYSEDLRWKIIQGAIEAGDAEWVGILIQEWDINVDEILCFGHQRQAFSAIELASGLMHDNVVSELLSRDADVNITGLYTRTSSGLLSGGALYWLLNSRRMRECLGHTISSQQVPSRESEVSMNLSRDAVGVIRQLVKAGIRSPPIQEVDAFFSTLQVDYSILRGSKQNLWSFDDLKDLHSIVKETELSWIFSKTILDIAQNQRVTPTRYHSSNLAQRASSTTDMLHTVVSLHSPLAVQCMVACGAILASPDKPCSCNRRISDCFEMLCEMKVFKSPGNDRWAKQPCPVGQIDCPERLSRIENSSSNEEAGSFLAPALSKQCPWISGEDQLLISAIEAGDDDLAERHLTMRQDRLIIHRRMIKVLHSSKHDRILKMLVSGDAVLTRGAVTWAITHSEKGLLDALVDSGLRIDDADGRLRGKACKSNDRVILERCLDLIHQDSLEGGNPIDNQSDNDTVTDTLLTYIPKGVRAAQTRTVGEILTLAVHTGRTQEIHKALRHDIDFFTHISWLRPHETQPQSLLARLIKACTTRGEEGLRLVLRSCCKKSNINRCVSLSSSSASMTPLLLAIEQESLSLVQTMVIEFEADINLAPIHGRRRTPLQQAAEQGQYDIAKWLLERGAMVNGKINQRGGATALQLAARQGYCGMMELLINHGADMDAPGAFVKGRTALEGAAENGRLDAVKLLLDSGMRIRRDQSDVFKRVVYLARQNGHVDVAELLGDYWRTSVSPSNDGARLSLELDLDLSERDNYLVVEEEDDPDFYDSTDSEASSKDD